MAVKFKVIAGIRIIIAMLTSLKQLAVASNSCSSSSTDGKQNQLHLVHVIFHLL